MAAPSKKKSNKLQPVQKQRENEEDADESTTKNLPMSIDQPLNSAAPKKQYPILLRMALKRPAKSVPPEATRADRRADGAIISDRHAAYGVAYSRTERHSPIATAEFNNDKTASGIDNPEQVLPNPSSLAGRKFIEGNSTAGLGELMRKEDSSPLQEGNWKNDEAPAVSGYSAVSRSKASMSVAKPNALRVADATRKAPRPGTSFKELLRKVSGYSDPCDEPVESKKHQMTNDALLTKPTPMDRIPRNQSLSLRPPEAKRDEHEFGEQDAVSHLDPLYPSALSNEPSSMLSFERHESGKELQVHPRRALAGPMVNLDSCRDGVQRHTASSGGASTPEADISKTMR
jgi:hypothetical protein